VTFYWNWDVAGAEREFRRALELNPNYVVAHHWYATFLMVLGRFPEALREIDRAQQLDPASTPILADKALILSHQGHTDQATTLLRQLEVAQPAFFSTHQYLSDIYLANREYANYLEEARKSAELSHDESQLTMLDAAEQGFKSGGRQGMLENILGIQKKLDAEGRVPAFLVATTYGYLGNKTEALRYLEISERRHEASFISIRSHQAFYSLHDDPSFRNLVEQAGLPPLP
jgi:tetratricopeptide (TPR) repeat protein